MRWLLRDFWMSQDSGAKHINESFSLPSRHCGRKWKKKPFNVCSLKKVCSDPLSTKGVFDIFSHFRPNTCHQNILLFPLSLETAIEDLPPGMGKQAFSSFQGFWMINPSGQMHHPLLCLVLHLRVKSGDSSLYWNLLRDKNDDYLLTAHSPTSRTLWALISSAYQFLPV